MTRAGLAIQLGVTTKRLFSVRKRASPLHPGHFPSDFACGQVSTALVQ